MRCSKKQIFQVTETCSLPGFYVLKSRAVSVLHECMLVLCLLPRWEDRVRMACPVPVPAGDCLFLWLTLPAPFLLLLPVVRIVLALPLHLVVSACLLKCALSTWCVPGTVGEAFGREHVSRQSRPCSRGPCGWRVVRDCLGSWHSEWVEMVVGRDGVRRRRRTGAGSTLVLVIVLETSAR